MRVEEGVREEGSAVSSSPPRRRYSAWVLRPLGGGMERRAGMWVEGVGMLG